MDCSSPNIVINNDDDSTKDHYFEDFTEKDFKCIEQIIEFNEKTIKYIKSLLDNNIIYNFTFSDVLNNIDLVYNFIKDRYQLMKIFKNIKPDVQDPKVKKIIHLLQTASTMKRLFTQFISTQPPEGGLCLFDEIFAQAYSDQASVNNLCLPNTPVSINSDEWRKNICTTKEQKQTFCFYQKGSFITLRLF